jgi:hypothetical protein
LDERHLRHRSLAKVVIAAFYAMVLVGWALAVVIGAALVRWLRR